MNWGKITFFWKAMYQLLRICKTSKCNLLSYLSYMQQAWNWFLEKQ